MRKGNPILNLLFIICHSFFYIYTQQKEIADYAISFSMTRTGFEPVLPP